MNRSFHIIYNQRLTLYILQCNDIDKKNQALGKDSLWAMANTQYNV